MVTSTRGPGSATTPCSTVHCSTLRRPAWESKAPDEIAASLKQKFPVFTKEELLTDMEYGGTPLSRAVINVNVAFQELGKK